MTAVSAPGNVLGKYRLIAELGRGGMSEVFLALVHGPAGFNKLMVIKRLRPHLAEEPEFLQMFLDEARLAAKLNHPNIVQTLEVGEAKGQFFISMEYLEGQPLNRVLRRSDDVSLPMVLRILCDAASGLHHAHELRDYDGTALHIVHRDVTPHNIFVTYDGQVKVVDFGIAKAVISVAETRTGVLKGKVSYMAPEQARAETVDRRADIFSLGCCLWEAITGERVWKGKSDIQVLNIIMAKDPQLPSPRALVPSLHPRLEAITARALAFDRDDRYQTALELRRDLLAHLDEIGDRSTSMAAAGLIAKRFASERETLRALVERQMKTASDLPTGEYARVTLPRLPGPPASLASVAVDGSNELPDSTPLSAGPHHATTGGTVSLYQEGRAGNRMPAFLALAAFGVILVVAVVSLRPAPEPATTTARSAPTMQVTTKAVPPPTPAPVPEVSITIHTSPEGAQVLLDDRDLGKSPLVLELPADRDRHRLVIAAPGYETLARDVHLDRSLSLDLTLRRSPTPPIRPPASPPLAPPPPFEERKPATDARPIDDENPYR